MLGGIADSTAGKLLRGDYIEQFVMMGIYCIPKKYVIDYVLGDHYAHYQNIAVSVFCPFRKRFAV